MEISERSHFCSDRNEQNIGTTYIVDESKVFEHAGIDQDQYMPVVHIYFNDDLTDDDVTQRATQWGLLSPVPFLD